MQDRRSRTGGPEITETQLPGVGVRHEFRTAHGDRVAVISHRGGRRQVLLFEETDPDACSTVLNLGPEESLTLAELLGAVQVGEALAGVQRVPGLAIDWVTIPAESSTAGVSLADGRYRTQTGASVVAVVRGDTTVAAPGADFTFRPGDVVVTVGTPEGVEQLRTLLRQA